MATIRFTTEKMIAALQQTNGLVSLAAKNLGCAPKTIYQRAHEVQAVQQAIIDSREELVDVAELALRACLTNKEAWAVALVLKTLGKNRGYVERQEITGADGGELTVRYVNDWRHTTESTSGTENSPIEQEEIPVVDGG